MIHVNYVQKYQTSMYPYFYLFLLANNASNMVMDIKWEQED